MPVIEPPAINPELNSTPALRSDSCGFPFVRSTHHLTSPPAKIGAVVAIGKYDPTAKVSERTPHNSSTAERKTPIKTSPHGRFWLRRPLMIVAISVACGAARFGEPMP